jgi:hypothetical protein
LNWLTHFSTTKSYIFDAKPCLDGGVLIGTSSRYDAQDPANQAIGYWAGAIKPNYTTGTITCGYGETTVVGVGTSWLANVEPGMFLFNNASFNTFLGEVKSVESNTSLTLVDKILKSRSANNYALVSVRPLGNRTTTGRITCTTGSATVTGANTKFKYQKLDNGTWDIFRAVDMKYVGQVSSVASNTSLTLTGNAGQNLDNEQYVAVQQDHTYAYDTGTTELGFITAVYARRQFYANRADHKDTDKIWFSSEIDFEAVDKSKQDGDFVRVKGAGTRRHNSPIKAMVPAYNSLLIIKESETYALFGESPDSFEVRKIADDGVLCGMSAQPYKGGVVYAGREAIYWYDGVEAQNISQDKLGEFYKQCVSTFDPETFRMWGMTYRDHYFLHIESVTPPFGVTRGNSSTTPSRLTIVIYLPTYAYSVFTNFDFRGHLALNPEEELGMWYLINDNTGVARVCKLDDVFDTEGLDVLTCEGNTLGPRFHLEMKRFDGDEQVRKKLWKQLTAHYSINGDTLTVDVIPGLDQPGTATSTTFPDTTGAWTPKRVKFLKRAHHLGLRVYETTQRAATSVKLGPFALVIKRQRPQKV